MRCRSFHTAAAVPVDLAAPSGERPWGIGVVGVAQRRTVRIDRALNRGDGWPGRLEDRRWNQILGLIIVTVQVVKTGIMPRRVLADRFREAETEPLPPARRLHRRR